MKEKEAEKQRGREAKKRSREAERQRFFFTSLPLTSLLLVSLLLASSPSAHACPLCKDALSKMGEIWTAIGFNLSIYFMIAIPFLLVGSFALVLYLKLRKQKRA